ncbi:hypothetical protein NX059_010643 [Plenodomus lindquistii]|nr:hypothetical protein NX059_010643 [Plenodomus lindquistii]
MVDIQQAPPIQRMSQAASQSGSIMPQPSAPLLAPRTAGSPLGITESLLESLLVQNQQLIQTIKEQAEVLNGLSLGFQQSQSAQQGFVARPRHVLIHNVLPMNQENAGSLDDRSPTVERQDYILEPSKRTSTQPQLDDGQLLPASNRIEVKAEEDTHRAKIKIKAKDTRRGLIQVDTEEIPYVKEEDEVEDTQHVEIKTEAEHAHRVAGLRRSLRQRNRKTVN